MMAMNVQYRFGVYVIDPLARTVLKDGEPKALEPKVFDVIVHLITHRSRVVTKQELLEKVWGEQVVVTDGVVARTVMKARRLIGDDADEPSIIKTVHRVGYRFVAPLEEELAPAAGETRTPSAAARRHAHDGRIAILPFHNRTGNPDLAWIDLGLMATTIGAMTAKAGVNLVSATDLLAVVGAHDAGLALEVAAQKVANALGADDIVQASVTQDIEAEFTLRYEGAGPRLGALHGAISGVDPIELCRKLAVEVERCVATVPEPLQPPEVKDAPFLRVAHARALQAIHTERWEMARKLLRVALDIAPDDLSLQLDHARCLAWLRDPQAAPLLEHVLEHAKASDNKVLELRALHHMAVYRHGLGQFAQAERLLSQALKLAEEQDDQEAELQLLISLGEILAGEGRSAVANWMLDRAAQLARTVGNHVVSARVLDIRGRVAMLNEDTLAALKDFDDAVKLSEQYGIHGGAAFSLTHLGSGYAGLGRIAEAVSCFDRAFVHACRSGDPLAIGRSGGYVVVFGALWKGDLQRGADIVEQMRRLGANAPVIQSCADFSEALLMGRKGDLKESLALLDRAEMGWNTSRSFIYNIAKQRIRVLVCLGLLEEAADLCEELESRASGRLRRYLATTALHHRGLIARADGSDSVALKCLLECVAESPPSGGDRASAGLDAAWLLLESGEVEQAQQLLSSFSDFLEAALASEYGPAMLVQARLQYEVGNPGVAVALQQRYCEMQECSPQSGAVRCLALYQQAPDTLERIPRVRALPSLFDLVPGMGPARSSMHQ